MISGHDIIYISSIEWNFLWQVHQEIALRMARAGNRVLYIENTGVRSPGLRDASRVFSRLKHWATALRSRGVREVSPNVYVSSPLVLPPFGPRWQRKVNRRLLLPSIKRIARDLGMRDPLLWTYLPTDNAMDLIQLLRTSNSLQVYYCVADFAQLTPHVEALRLSEETVVRTSDLVFTNCAELAGHCRQWSDDVYVFPPGVDLEAFPLSANTNGNDRPDEIEESHDPEFDAVSLRLLPKPIIGYVGGLHRHVDFDLIAEMARARPKWSWVFVGPFQTAVEKLDGLSNVHLLGARPHNELVAYMRSFDVCIVPYIKSAYTDTVVPVKVNEYLAVGKPVVSTEIPTVREFNDRHNVLITAASRAEDFLQAIERSLQIPKDAATISRRREVAALADWQARLEAMSQLLEDKFKEKHHSPAEEEYVLSRKKIS